VTIPALTLCLDMSHYQARKAGGREGRGKKGEMF